MINNDEHLLVTKTSSIRTKKHNNVSFSGALTLDLFISEHPDKRQNCWNETFLNCISLTNIVT
ncbi:MAG: hypothetical protein ACRC7H_00045, partial [Plesiomonas shigelloides]